MATMPWPQCLVILEDHVMVLRSGSQFWMGSPTSIFIHSAIWAGPACHGAGNLLCLVLNGSVDLGQMAIQIDMGCRFLPWAATEGTMCCGTRSTRSKWWPQFVNWATRSRPQNFEVLLHQFSHLTTQNGLHGSFETINQFRSKSNISSFFADWCSFHIIVIDGFQFCFLLQLLLWSRWNQQSQVVRAQKDQQKRGRWKRPHIVNVVGRWAQPYPYVTTISIAFIRKMQTEEYSSC